MPKRTHGYEMDMDEEQDEGEPDAVENECDGGNPGGIEEARKLGEVREDPGDFEMKMVKETHMIWKKQIRAGDQVVLVAQERAPLDARWDHLYTVTQVQGPVLTVVNMRTGKRRVINRDKVKLVDPDLVWSDVRPHPTQTARRPLINIPAPVVRPQLFADQQQDRSQPETHNHWRGGGQTPSTVTFPLLVCAEVNVLLRRRRYSSVPIRILKAKEVGTYHVPSRRRGRERVAITVKPREDASNRHSVDLFERCLLSRSLHRRWCPHHERRLL